MYSQTTEWQKQWSASQTQWLRGIQNLLLGAVMTASLVEQKGESVLLRSMVFVTLNLLLTVLE